VGQASCLLGDCLSQSDPRYIQKAAEILLALKTSLKKEEHRRVKQDQMLQKIRDLVGGTPSKSQRQTETPTPRNDYLLELESSI
jgi:hypothetical protein